MRKTLATSAAAAALLVLAACGSSSNTEDVRAASADTSTAPPSTTTTSDTTTTTVATQKRSTTTAPPTTRTTRTSPTPTTTNPRRLAKPVEWIVGFHQWPGLKPGDRFLGETITNTHKKLRFIVLESDDATFKRRAEQHRNVRYVQRNKKLVVNDAISLPHHDYGPGDTVPAGPRWPFANAGITGGPKEGCVWLLDENDKRYNVLWPEGYTMRYGEPLTIYNENHEPVWQTGQRLDIDTQPSRSAEHWQRVHPTCRVSSKDKDQPDEPIALIMPAALQPN